jgi:hypothetical protein
MQKNIQMKWLSNGYSCSKKLIKTTPGFGPGPSGRSFAYFGLTMYESILPGMPSYQSLFLQLAGNSSFPSYKHAKEYYWPASVNAAMAQIIKSLFANTSDANKATIDSLEDAFTAKFYGKASGDELQRSVGFGKEVATVIFEWSKTDGTLNVNPPYIAPVGPGLWEPTPHAFAPPANPYGGKTNYHYKN